MRAGKTPLICCAVLCCVPELVEVVVIVDSTWGGDYDHYSPLEINYTGDLGVNPGLYIREQVWHT